MTTDLAPFTGGNRTVVGGVPVSTDHYIGGKRVASAATFEDRSPLDWSIHLADVSRGDAAIADMAVTAAVDAFPEWAAMGVKGRGDVMRRVADLIDQYVPALAAVECLDMAMLEESLRLRVLSAVPATSAPTPTSPSSTRSGCGRATARRTA